MPLNMQVIQTSDFIRQNSEGEYDQQQSLEVLKGVAQVCVERGINCALLDVRDARSDMKMDDVYQLAQAFKEVGFQKKQRLAMLYRASGPERVEFFGVQPGERAKLFAMCASDDGWNVRAFDDYGKAIEWFAEASPAD
jgi:hypothetical protein